MLCVTEFTTHVWSCLYPIFAELVGLPKTAVLLLTAEIASEYQASQEQRGRPTSLLLRDEVMLFLLHMWYFPVDIFLAAIYHTSKQTVNNVRTFYNVLTPKLTMQTLEWCVREGVKLFHHTYTFAIDGSEQKVLTSDSSALETESFSVKKDQNSVNIVIACSLKSKRILIVSKSHLGSTSDKEIVKESLTE